jgi:hypothetical protein
MCGARRAPDLDPDKKNHQNLAVIARESGRSSFRALDKPCSVTGCPACAACMTIPDRLLHLKAIML